MYENCRSRFPPKCHAIQQSVLKHVSCYAYLCLPIYFAVEGNSFEFCKVLIDEYPESIRIINGSGYSPIHTACGYGHRVDIVDTIQYMLDIDPESINAMSQIGFSPIHLAVFGGVRTIELLLKHDPDAATKVTDNVEGLSRDDGISGVPGAS